MTLPIYYANTTLQLGEVFWPPYCQNIPGLEVNKTAPIDMGDGNWKFPILGVYYWQSATADGLILIRTYSRTAAADMALKIISGSVYGDASEANDYWANPLGETARLFSEPGQRNWNCGPAAGALINILAEMAIPARMCQWASLTGDMHQNTEVNLGTEGGWTLYDPHLGLIYLSGYDGTDLFTGTRAGNITQHNIRHFQLETPWYQTPWTVLETFNMALGLFAATPMPVVLAAGVTEAQVEQTLGLNVTVKTPAQMRTLYYA